MTNPLERSDDELTGRISSLKERIYATFTGLAILAALDSLGHTDAWEAFLTVLVGVFGISAAGFLAEIVAYQVVHKRFPSGTALAEMVRVALTALASSSAPLIVLAISGLGLIESGLAVRISIGMYAAALVVVFLIAAHRSGVTPLQRVLSSAMLIGLAGLVVGLLLLAKVL